jgi:hypothetical protein
MTHPTKKRLYTAISAVLGSAALAAALPVNASDNGIPPVGDSATNTGDVATAFYIAQPEGGWQTFFNVTNTSESALAVKVRIKEFKNSRDALDFWILMSPKDVWTGWMVEEADGIYIRTVDNSCTSPQFDVVGLNKGKKLETSAFFGPGPDNADDGGSLTADEALDRLKLGHVEFIVAGECSAKDRDCFLPGGAKGFGEPDGIGWLTKHVDGVPNNCAKADEYFIARDTWDQRSVPGDGNPKANDPNYDSYGPVKSAAPLKVNVAYLQVGDGTGASTSAMHLDGVTTGQNLITAQNYPYFLEPTIATAPAGIWDIRGLLDLEQRFTWTNTFQEWSVNPAAGVQTSLMLNFPTKGYHVDQYCSEPYASSNRWRWNGSTALACATADDAATYNGITPGVDYSPLAGTGDLDGVRLEKYVSLKPFPKRWANGKSDVQIGITTFDREEFFLDETYWSPFRELNFLPWEVALIDFDENGGAFGDLPTAKTVIPAPAALGAPNGWIDLEFVNQTGPTDGTDVHGQSFEGLPMHGIMVKTRDLGIPGTAYGQGTENGYGWAASFSSAD